uniref:Uncharacterized protein n=1 Tax=Panagrolaimus superbus TaxID=310955 RepID=A0A914YP81_9BILA
MKEKNEILFEHSIKYGLEKLIDYGQACDKLELIRNIPYENIIAICNAKFNNFNVKEVTEYFRSIMSRYHSPSQSIINLMTEMDMVIKSNIHNKNDANFLLKIGEGLTTNDPEINDEICEFIQLRNCLLDDNRYLCRKCFDFDSHVS